MKKTLFLLASMALFALCLTSCEETNSPSEPSAPSTPIVDGMLSGEFSVSAEEKVHFSQGNLQYVGTWKFAEHQWDFFGKNQSDNHRDLFGWGTGNAPNKVSTDYADYATYTEWGNNPITNGGNKANQWRTLTDIEWKYLFRGRKNAKTLFWFGKIDGIRGVILLPDNCTLSHIPGDDTYTKEQWSVMEKAGAVFLPAAGSRDGTDVDYGFGSYGRYWSCMPDDLKFARLLYFDPSTLNPQYPCFRDLGVSVRLVR